MKLLNTSGTMAFEIKGMGFSGLERRSNKTSLFELIAPIYGLFYDYQKRHYNAVIRGIISDLDFSGYRNIIDIGCGTGALCSVLHQSGLFVTGIDSAQGMLKVAMKKNKNKDIEFVQASVLEGLPFTDRTFDISIASYVAHGLKEPERKKMYAEMKRISKRLVIIYDYNANRSFLTNIVEWLEGGDYFNFIRKVKLELKECFGEIQVFDVDLRAAWYICKIEEKG